MFNLIICCNKRDHLLARCKLAGVFSEARSGMQQESQIRMVINVEGTKCYYNNENQYHRKFGPAIEFASGYKLWFLNGKQHREDGPACEWADGSRQWWINGKLHRTDGPASIYANDDKRWFLNDQSLTEAEFLKHPLCTIK